jgi:molecular chaperone DnaK
MHLGIDLGTSNSAIVAHTGSQLRLFKTADGTDVLPSAVYIDPRGHRFVGRRAYEQAALTPDNVAREFKRLMGTSTPLKLARGTVTLTPEEASAEVLRTLLTQARTEAGDEAIEGTIVTIPAAFNQMQTEATIAAADLAGISPVGLIHEPIAAAMASMASSTVRTGQFLVYDLGGGTFDVALVQASSGTVNIVAHEGVNMLGGKDFDDALMRDIISPWLESHFDLAPDYRLDPDFQRLLKRVKLQVEKAKIELSSMERTSIFLGDDEIRMTDRAGAEMFVDVEFTREALERLIAPQIDRTVELCHKVIRDNGFSAADLDRVVLIGGPSKMPMVRQRVPEALGIPADVGTDPMTAVATGAAIYAESRVWSGAHTSRKSSRASQTVKAAVAVKYDYPARVADERATLRISTEGDVAGWRLRIDAFDGWSSGDIDLAEKLRVELPLAKPGENRFRATLVGPGQAPQITELLIARTFASSAGVPATLTICVAVEQDVGGARREVLSPLVTKGTILPNSGRASFRAGRALVGGGDDYIDVKVYQSPEGINDPALGLLVGSFRLEASKHLQTGEVLRQGDAIHIDWSMDDSGVLDAKVSLPDHAVVFDMGRMFSPRAGHKDFGGADGAELADGLVTEAAKSVEEVEEALGETAWSDVQKLKRRLDAQSSALANSEEPDVRRQAAEEALAIRQEVARLRSAPENQSLVISRELANIEEVYEEVAGILDDEALAGRVSQLSASARRLLDDGHHDQAQACVNQIRSLVVGEMMKRPDFIEGHFERLARERYLAIDKSLHDKLVHAGLACIRSADWDGLRRVNAGLIDNHFNSASAEPLTTQLVGLMRS